MIDALTRFRMKVWFSDPCWWWTGKPYKGYGQFELDGYRTGAHRASFLLFVGGIPDRHEIHHICGNKLCVNPAHLEPLPLDGRPHRALHVALTTVHRCGHEISELNTYIDANGGRACRICRGLAARRSHVRAGRRREPNNQKES